MTPNQEFIAKLSEGYSTQSKTANKFWLVLIISSIIALVGRSDKENFIDLPFTLGRVNSADFYSICIILLSVVIIAFTTAMVQTIRTRSLIQSAIDSLNKEELFISTIHIQDYFDSVASPTYNRVGPIAYYLLGKSQFHGTKRESGFIRFLGMAMYFFLKIATYFFLYLVPVWAIFKCWDKKNENIGFATIHIPSFVLVFLICLAFISMFILFVGDLKHIIKISKKIIK